MDDAVCHNPDTHYIDMAAGGKAANGHQLLSPVSIKTMFANSLAGGKAVSGE